MVKNITIIKGDCLKIMDKLIEQGIKVDAVITDPPYNISKKNNFKTLGTRSKIGMDFGEWDKNFNLTSYIKKIPFLVNENSNIIIFNAWQNLGIIKKACFENNILIKRCLVLSKSNPAPFNRDRMFVNDVEFALWGVYNSKNKPTKWTFNREEKLEKCVFLTTTQSSKLHPTAKDIKVISKLVKLLTNENDTILDMFMGSGTTGVACKNLNRKFIGIELDDKYFEIARNRIKNN